jgi:hypothetical protein
MEISSVGRVRRWRAAGIVAVLLVASAAGAEEERDRFSVQASLERNDLFTERLGLLRELKDLDEEISEAEKPLTVSGSITRVRGVHSIRESHLDGLRNQRERLRARMQGIDHRFQQLTNKVVRYYGERPPWWTELE